MASLRHVKFVAQGETNSFQTKLTTRNHKICFEDVWDFHDFWIYVHQQFIKFEENFMRTWWKLQKNSLLLLSADTRKNGNKHDWFCLQSLWWYIPSERFRRFCRCWYQITLKYPEAHFSFSLLTLIFKISLKRKLLWYLWLSKFDYKLKKK